MSIPNCEQTKIDEVKVSCDPDSLATHTESLFQSAYVNLMLINIASIFSEIFIIFCTDDRPRHQE